MNQNNRSSYALPFFFLAIAMCNFSCKDDADEVIPVIPQVLNIEGVWKMSALNFSSESSGSIFGIPFSEDTEGTASNMNLTLTFNADNSFTAEGDYSLDLDIDASALGESESTETSIPVTYSALEGAYTLNDPDLTIVKESGTVTTDEPDVEAPMLILGSSRVDVFQDVLTIIQTTDNSLGEITSSSSSTTSFQRQ